MMKRQVRLVGPKASGQQVDANALRGLLDVLIDGSQRALRLRVQGRSTARGAPPTWLSSASAFSLQLKPGSTVLDIDAPALRDAAPEQFSQSELFTEIETSRPSFDYLSESLEAAKQGDSNSHLYDAALLDCLGKLDSVFQHGVDEMEFQNDISESTPLVRLSRMDVAEFRSLSKRIPPPQYVKVVGKLDMIRDSDSTFQVQIAGVSSLTKGIAAPGDELSRLFAKDVLVTGTAFFAANGTIQRIEADGPLRLATPAEASLFGARPRSLSRSLPPQSQRVAQGPKSGLASIFGKWPGSETDDEIAAALDSIS